MEVCNAIFRKCTQIGIRLRVFLSDKFRLICLEVTINSMSLPVLNLVVAVFYDYVTIIFA